VVHTQKSNFQMKNNWDFVCEWLDFAAGGDDLLVTNVKDMFIESLRFYGSLRGFFQSPQHLSNFLVRVISSQGRGERLERWIVEAKIETTHKLRPSKVTVFTFTRADSQPKKRV